MRPVNILPDPKNRIAFSILEKLVLENKKDAPLVIGITGARGAGKTTFSRNIVKYYGEDNCLSIDLDDYLLSRYERGKLEITGYNPAANKLLLAKRQIEHLINGKSISKPRYDHKKGLVVKNELVHPRELIIIEGVTTLYDELRELSVISFYLDATDATQIQSRIHRDVKKRGYTEKEALELFEALQPEYKKFIEPTKQYASKIFLIGLDYIMHPIDN
jgi:phosphoribulokinase